MSFSSDKRKYESMYNRMSRKLVTESSELSDRFVQRLSGIRENSQVLTAVKGLDQALAFRTALEYFGKGEYTSVGIDGSMDYDERLETLLFYVNASAYSAPFLVSGDGIKVSIKEIRRSVGLSSYAAVPLWLEDLSDIFMNQEAAETEYDFHTSIEKIPFALMTMAEIWTALNSARTPGVKLIFMDRPLYGTYTSALKDLRVMLRSGISALTKIKTQYGSPSMLDMSLASIIGPGFSIPKRVPYQIYGLLSTLISRGSLSESSISEELAVSHEDAARLYKWISKKDAESGGELLDDSGTSSLKVKDGVKNYWKRVISASEYVARKAFETDEHPLKVRGNAWLTIYELNAINVFLLFELVWESLKNRILLVGITKDTAASDFTRSLLPFSQSTGIIKGPYQLSFRNDRGFLTVLAAVNYEKLKTPWRTISYDSSFASMNGNQDSTPVLGAARKYISREKFFVKSYFQLRTFATDPQMRSPVFAYDRPFMEDYDLYFVKGTTARSRSGIVNVEIFFEGGGMNKIDNLLLYLLLSSDNPEVLEACGHNQLLYMADKQVKYEIKMAKNALKGIADLQLGALARKERIFSISRRFRDLRAESERLREEGAGREAR
ncbi:MAG: DNA double-strand break repair nuclease NurA [Nitrososphaerota archaeon]|jgi:hypothetical protein|nr:DNA double-strand break repair nuclease NurA [Nitrososphaerota archaeon]MDG6927367.1 DNA double-strand break repair nuclease NurA [Nitrososphaerota archaeon]MDG6930905.1 DNA double-strand break repair nuclease NurA [Nitrososphaerota archaeon]MDG6932205.1 DNA double-strand break repair nuclease NurA [Nitrososphaerota archaeon]MDG6935802.1 DNA double-strand break repair nuclease NurA [Nitrososphaerota archaeon]